MEDAQSTTIEYVDDEVEFRSHWPAMAAAIDQELRPLEGNSRFGFQSAWVHWPLHASATFALGAKNSDYYLYVIASRRDKDSEWAVFHSLKRAYRGLRT